MSLSSWGLSSRGCYSRPLSQWAIKRDRSLWRAERQTPSKALLANPCFNKGDANRLAGPMSGLHQALMDSFKQIYWSLFPVEWISSPCRPCQVQTKNDVRLIRGWFFQHQWCHCMHHAFHMVVELLKPDLKVIDFKQKKVLWLCLVDKIT